MSRSPKSVSSMVSSVCAPIVNPYMEDDLSFWTNRLLLTDVPMDSASRPVSTGLPPLAS